MDSLQLVPLWVLSLLTGFVGGILGAFVFLRLSHKKPFISQGSGLRGPQAPQSRGKLKQTLKLASLIALVVAVSLGLVLFAPFERRSPGTVTIQNLEGTFDDPRLAFLFENETAFDDFVASLEEIKLLQGENEARARFNIAVGERIARTLRESKDAARYHWWNLASIFSEAFGHYSQEQDIASCRQILYPRGLVHFNYSPFGSRFFEALMQIDASHKTNQLDYSPGEPQINYLYMTSRLIANYGITRGDLPLFSADYSRPDIPNEIILKACYMHWALFSELLNEDFDNIARFMVDRFQPKSPVPEEPLVPELLAPELLAPVR